MKKYFFASSILILAAAGFFLYTKNRSEILRPFMELRFSWGGGEIVAFLETPERKRYLINAGSVQNIVLKLGEYLPFFLRKIDGVVFTGVENKYSKGLFWIRQKYIIGNIFRPTTLGKAQDELSFTRNGATALTLTGGVLSLDSATRLYPVERIQKSCVGACMPMLLCLEKECILFLEDLRITTQKYVHQDLQDNHGDKAVRYLFVGKISSGEKLIPETLDLIAADGSLIYSPSGKKVEEVRALIQRSVLESTKRKPLHLIEMGEEVFLRIFRESS